MATARTSLILSLLLCAGTAIAQRAPGAQDGIPADQFGKLRELIRPHEGESNWRHVEWLTSLHEARVRAAAEGKPILVWSGGGAPPLGGC
jgi:hypothetical protein